MVENVNTVNDKFVARKTERSCNAIGGNRETGELK